jgi:hypothetical protein
LKKIKWSNWIKIKRQCNFQKIAKTNKVTINLRYQFINIVQRKPKDLEIDSKYLRNRLFREFIILHSTDNS